MGVRTLSRGSIAVARPDGVPSGETDCHAGIVGDIAPDSGAWGAGVAPGTRTGGGVGAGSGSGGRRAVFFDRDGVLTEPIWNPATGEYESPHTLRDLVLCADAIAPLRRLAAAGYALFIVSNQPSYAKGKTTLEEIRAIADATVERFRAGGVTFLATYYCYHHPRGIVPEYSGPCDCRKPSPHFIRRAAVDFALDLQQSWMMGDRDSDITCGQRAGCRTILIAHPQARAYQGASSPEFIEDNVGAAAERILGQTVSPPRGAARQAR